MLTAGENLNQYFANRNAMPTGVNRDNMARWKHECATTTIARNGQVVVYSGGGELFDYLYEFVTAGIFNPDNRVTNMDLLDRVTQ